jgi:hypothetical protein
MTMIRTFVGATLAAAALAAAPAAAQQTGDDRPTLSVQAGGFMYDREGDANYAMGAVRVDWPVSRYVRAEVGGSYSRPTTTVVRVIDTNHTTQGIPSHANVFTTTVGVQAQLPTRFATPYVGMATGLFGRFDTNDGERFISTTQEFMTGLRVPVSERIGVRGELRFRFDRHQNSGTASDVEQTLGITVRL